MRGLRAGEGDSQQVVHLPWPCWPGVWCKPSLLQLGTTDTLTDFRQHNSILEMFPTGHLRRGRVLAGRTLIPRDTLCVRTVGRTSPRLPFALRGWETAPRTAIWVHFQLFCHKIVIGPLARNRADWAVIGRAGPGLCSAYVTADVTWQSWPPCWIELQQALQTNETQWENLLTNIHLTPTPTTQFTAKVS